MSEDILKTLRWFRRIIPNSRPASTPPPSQKLAPWGGEMVDLDRFWAEAWTALKARQEDLRLNLKLANAEWRVNQESGLIEFARTDGAVVRAPVQIIGAWNASSEMFSWGWDHPSVHPRLRADAERTRWFGDAHALHDLTERKIAATEAEAWRLAAIAMRVNAAAGVYRAPTDGPVVFMTLGEPTLIAETEREKE